MKIFVTAIALAIAVPAVAQTGGQQSHAQHQGHGQAGHSQHQGQHGQHGQHQPGQHQGHGDCCADRNGNGRMDCCEQSAQAGDRRDCCPAPAAQSGGQPQD